MRDTSRSSTLPPRALISDLISEKMIEAKVGLAKIAASTLRCLELTRDTTSENDINRKSRDSGVFSDA